MRLLSVSYNAIGINMPFFRCFILLLGVLAAGGVTIRDYQPGDNMDSEDLKSYCEVFECLVAVDAPTSKVSLRQSNNSISAMRFF